MTLQETIAQYLAQSKNRGAREGQKYEESVKEVLAPAQAFDFIMGFNCRDAEIAQLLKVIEMLHAALVTSEGYIYYGSQADGLGGDWFAQWDDKCGLKIRQNALEIMKELL